MFVRVPTWPLAFVLAALLSACVATRVTSVTSTHGNASLERLLIVLRPGSFGSAGSTNTAGSLGNRNLGELVPHLYARLPLAFEAQGVRARMVSEADLKTVRVQPGEKLLWLQGDRASYSSRGGQSLTLVAELVEPSPRTQLWRGEIHMGTLGFGKFDDTVADGIGRQLVEQLQSARAVVMPGAPAPAPALAASAAPSASPAIAVAPLAPASAGTPAAVAPPAPTAPRRSVASGFASIDDVDAIPYLNDRGRKGYQDWLRRPTPRAFAIADDGHWYATWGRPADPDLPADAGERALQQCARNAGRNCKLYAVNGAVVWRPTP